MKQYIILNEGHPPFLTDYYDPENHEPADGSEQTVIDSIYMQATIAMTGGTVLLIEIGSPFDRCFIGLDWAGFARVFCGDCRLVKAHHASIPTHAHALTHFALTLFAFTHPALAHLTIMHSVVHAGHCAGSKKSAGDYPNYDNF